MSSGPDIVGMPRFREHLESRAKPKLCETMTQRDFGRGYRLCGAQSVVTARVDCGVDGGTDPPKGGPATGWLAGRKHDHVQSSLRHCSRACHPIQRVDPQPAFQADAWVRGEGGWVCVSVGHCALPPRSHCVWGTVPSHLGHTVWGTVPSHLGHTVCGASAVCHVLLARLGPAGRRPLRAACCHRVLHEQRAGWV
eukprot:365489-Chlamydomonas_euryale.AAC.2